MYFCGLIYFSDFMRSESLVHHATYLFILIMLRYVIYDMKLVIY